MSEIIKMVHAAGPRARMHVVDIKSAFRHMPIHRDDIPHMGFKDLNGKIYFEITLPFGLRSAPGLYDTLAQALEYILEKHGFENMVRFVDDFLMVKSADAPEHINNIDDLRALCDTLGISLSHEKIICDSHIVIYLGLEFDTIAQEVCLPAHKITALDKLLSRWLHKSKATRHELQQLSGKLIYTSEVIRTGRSYVQPILDCMRTLKEDWHHARVPARARTALAHLQTLIRQYPGKSLMARAPCDYIIATDASGSIGCGGFWNETGQWFYLPWRPHHVKLYDIDRDLSITWKELYAIIICAALFASEWQGKTVNILCDNQGAVDLISSRHSRVTEIMDIIFLLNEIEFTHDLIITSSHIPGAVNSTADAISRNQIERARTLQQNLSTSALALPSCIVEYEQKLESEWDQQFTLTRAAGQKRPHTSRPPGSAKRPRSSA
jgi:hypothetical protein